MSRPLYPNQQPYYGQPSYPPQPGYNPRFPLQSDYPQAPRGFAPQPQPVFGQSGYPQYPQQYPQQPQYPPQQPGYLPQGPIAYADPEDPEAKGFEFNDESIRKAFIRKVYSILTAQLVITLGFVALFQFHEPTRKFTWKYPWLMFVALGVVLVTMISMACCTNVRRKAPMNYIFLLIFTLAESFLLGMATSVYRLDEVFLAVGITAAVCLALTLFAFQTKWDFTVLGGVLFAAAIILLLFGILTIFIKGKIMSIIYASLGALIFSVYLIYDTQLMMGGKHKYSISPEEYIFAALNLYIDIINIFIHILTLIGLSRD